MAGRASVELHTLIFFRGKEIVADARITKVCLPQVLYSNWPVRAMFSRVKLIVRQSYQLEHL